MSSEWSPLRIDADIKAIAHQTLRNSQPLPRPVGFTQRLGLEVVVYANY